MIDASINQGAGGETWSWKLRTGPCRPHPDALRGQSGGRWTAVDDTPGVWITWRPSTTGVGFACGFTVE